MGICSLLLLLGDLKNTSVPGGVGGRRHGKQRIVSVFVVFSCLFVMPGDHEVERRWGCFRGVRLTLEEFSSVQVHKELSPAFLTKRNRERGSLSARLFWRFHDSSSSHSCSVWPVVFGTFLHPKSTNVFCPEPARKHFRFCESRDKSQGQSVR